VSDKNYALYLRIRRLNVRGTKVADARTETRGAKIHDWLIAAEDCLLRGKDKLAQELSAFRHILQECEFLVDEDEDETVIRKSAYYPLGERVDFRFEYLEQANDILRRAAEKLENPSDKKLREELYAARHRAGHSQREAALKMGYDHQSISVWETGNRKPHPKQAKNIRDYILLYPEAK